MVTMAQRIAQLRAERGVSAPALSAALGLPKMAVDKFEAGRLTPSQEQQEKLAAYFGVSVLYLRGENSDRTRMDDWMADSPAAPGETAAPKPRPAAPKPPAASSGAADATLFDAFLESPKFRQTLRAAVLDALRTPEGRALLAAAVRGEK